MKIYSSRNMGHLKQYATPVEVLRRFGGEEEPRIAYEFGDSVIDTLLVIGWVRRVGVWISITESGRRRLEGE